MMLDSCEKTPHAVVNNCVEIMSVMEKRKMKLCERDIVVVRYFVFFLKSVLLLLIYNTKKTQCFIRVFRKLNILLNFLYYPRTWRGTIKWKLFILVHQSQYKKQKSCREYNNNANLHTYT